MFIDMYANPFLMLKPLNLMDDFSTLVLIIFPVCSDSMDGYKALTSDPITEYSCSGSWGGGGSQGSGTPWVARGIFMGVSLLGGGSQGSWTPWEARGIVILVNFVVFFFYIIFVPVFSG